VRLALSACGAFVTLLTIAYAVLWLLYFAPADPLFYANGLRTVQVDSAGDFPVVLRGTDPPRRIALLFSDRVARQVTSPFTGAARDGDRLVFTRQTRRQDRRALLLAPPSSCSSATRCERLKSASDI